MIPRGLFIFCLEREGLGRDVPGGVLGRMALSGHFAPVPGLLASQAGGQDKVGV